jgi:hypothetical protein
VTSTPRPAAGLAILRERSDMEPTLPGPARGRVPSPNPSGVPPRRAGSDGAAGSGLGSLIRHPEPDAVPCV